jgi:hypothetical protein
MVKTGIRNTLFKPQRERCSQIETIDSELKVPRKPGVCPEAKKHPVSSAGHQTLASRS